MIENAPRRFDWSSQVRAYSEPGLSSCLAEGRLTLDGRRITATRVDLCALRLIEWAIEQRRSLILCPPEPFGALPALAAAAAHVSSILKYHARTGRSGGSDQRVAIVTSSFRLRGVYRRLGVSTASLFQVVPAAMRTRSGAVSILGEDPGRGWATMFLPRASDVAALGHVDVTVVELPLSDNLGVEDIPGTVVFIAHDPADPVLLRLAQRIPVFAWADADLATVSSIALVEGPAFAEELLRLKRAAKGIRCTPVPVAAQGVCENAALFWDDIGPLLRSGRHSPLGRELTAAAFVLFYDLMHLAMPTNLYERVTYPLHARLRELENAQRLTVGELKDLYVPMVAMELRDLAAAIGAESPKSEALLSVLHDRADRGDDILLVTRTAELARIHRSYIEGLGLEGSVRVTSLGGVPNEPPADVAILLGLLPAWARYLYTTAVATEIVVLAYDIESPLEAVPEGFTEYARVQEAVAYQHAYANWLARDAAKAACWAELSGTPSAVADDRPDPPRIGRPTEDAGPAAPPDSPPGLWDGVGVQLHRRLALDVPPRLSRDDDGGALEAPALFVEFTDGRWMYLDVGASVTRWHARGETEAGHLAQHVARGDQLVFLDGQARKDLLAKVLEVAGDVPELAVPAAWVDYWRDALRRARRTFETYERLHSELARRGCVRQTQTVRLWVIGQTIGPEDPEDIRRLGECLSDDALVANYTTIADAIQGLRSAHVRLGHRLGALARQVGAATAAGLMETDEIIDPRTGLSASDFRDSLEILTVASVHPAGTVPYALTGWLRPADEKEAADA